MPLGTSSDRISAAEREHISGLKPDFVVELNARAKASAYLRSNCKDNCKVKSNCNAKAKSGPST
jgi:hypothetical protein